MADVKRLARTLLPPAVVKAVRGFRNIGRLPKERGPDWYDHAFEQGDVYKRHYTESPYYSVWTVLIDRIRRCGSKSILEVGYGTGQLAWALHESGLMEDYCGFDFSKERIAQARENCPDLRFEVADAYETDLLETFGYTLVLCTEFLEHIEGDLRVIDRVRPGARFIGTVPSYPWTTHLRYFDNPEDVADRYGTKFDDFSVCSVRRNKDGAINFVLEGVKR